MCLISTIKRIIIGIILLVLQAGCGTTVVVDKPLAPLAGTDASASTYTLGECLIEDKRANSDTCVTLKDHIEYGLLSKGVIAKGGIADRDIKLTITFFYDGGGLARNMFGVLGGKEGIDVQVTIIDRQSREVVGSAKLSHYWFFAADRSEESLVSKVAEKTVEYITTAK